jgi:hypothetical protein
MDPATVTLVGLGVFARAALAGLGLMKDIMSNATIPK